MCHTNGSRAPEPPRRGPVGEHGPLELQAEDGNRFGAYCARSAPPAWARVVLLPDVRGLHPYYEDLAVRFAEVGCEAIAIDYYGRSGAPRERDDAFDWKSHFEKATPEGVAKDVHAAIERLRHDHPEASLPVFTVGFCFGGANSWRQSAEGFGIAGAIGFYGGHPLERVGPSITKLRAPLLLLLAGEDRSTTPAEFEEFARKVRELGVEVESHTYPGAPHSFFDRSFAEHQAACSDAWARLLRFMERHAASGGAPRPAAGSSSAAPPGGAR